MFRFTRAKILPLFLQRRITVAELARMAGISHQSAQKAVNGSAVSAVIIGKIAEALHVDAMDFIETPETGIIR